MDKDHLRTGDKATCIFRFIKNPEFLHNNARMVFREGRTKAIGNILRTIPYIPGQSTVAAFTNPPVKLKPSQAPKMQGSGKGRRGRGKRTTHPIVPEPLSTQSTLVNNPEQQVQK